jgi:hypothetical protein
MQDHRCSENAVRLDVGALVVAAFFAISFTSSEAVRRVCARVWRRGGLIGARFVMPKQLREGGAKKGQVRSELANVD